MAKKKVNPIIAAYAEDSEKATKGVRVALAGLPGGWAIVRRMPNVDYLHAMEQKYGDNQARLKELRDKGREEEARELDYRLLAEILAETVIVGLGYTDENGKEVSLSTEEIVDILADRSMLDLRLELLSYAEEKERFRKYDLKNS